MKTLNKPGVLLLFLLVLFTQSSCGYNQLQEVNENVKVAWAQVLNVYQRRTDLIPNVDIHQIGYCANFLFFINFQNVFVDIP